jgi:hypothetical protein
VTQENACIVFKQLKIPQAVLYVVKNWGEISFARRFQSRNARAKKSSSKQTMTLGQDFPDSLTWVFLNSVEKFVEKWL